MADDVELNTKQLDQFIKALKDNMSRVRVGVLGDKNTRNNMTTSGGKSLNARSGKDAKINFKKVNFSSNAAIGAIHEFGGAKMPQRSFLRVPISENLGKRMESSGAFDKDTLTNVIKEGSVIPWLKKIAVIAEAIVSDAFATGGFGKWPAWSAGYKNEGNRLLVDTGQLRDAVTSEVK